MKTKTTLAVIAVTVVQAALAGNVCNWSGQGDGVSWADPGNWQGERVPASPATSGEGDTVVIGDFGGTLNNNIDNLEIKELWFEGNKNVTLTGNAITIYAPLSGEEHVTFKNSCYVVLDVPLTLSRKCNFVPGNRIDFMKNVKLTTDPACWAYFKPDHPTAPTQKSIHFYGEFDGGSTSDNRVMIAIGDTGSPTYFHEKATFGKLWSGEYMLSPIHLCAPGNKYKEIRLCYQWVYFDCENAVDPDGNLDFWNNCYYQSANQTRCIFGTFNQKLDPTKSQTLWANYNLHATVGDSSDMVLTLCATKNWQTTVQVRGKCSIDWAPTGNYVGTFNGTEHTTEGDLIVSAGEFQIQEMGSFPYVPTVRVKSKAKFTANSKKESPALAGVRNLFVEDGGVFAVGSDSVASPLSGDIAICELNSTGRLAVPAGKSLLCKKVRHNGQFVFKGVYTGAGGTEGEVVDWIDGTGTVTVTVGNPGLAITIK